VRPGKTEKTRVHEANVEPSPYAASAQPLDKGVDHCNLCELSRVPMIALQMPSSALTSEFPGRGKTLPVHMGQESLIEFEGFGSANGVSSLIMTRITAWIERTVLFWM